MENEMKVYHVRNKIKVVGLIQDGLTFSHETMGEKFYVGMLRVKRKSRVEDVLPITIPGRLYEQARTICDKPIQIIGQIRTYNKIVDGFGRLFVTIHAYSIGESDEEAMNEVQLYGTIIKKPVYRTTPFGREICDLMIAVNRSYGKSDYLPCIAWECIAEKADTLNVGDRVEISGRIQSRDYEKKLDNGERIVRTAYEVSVFKLEMERENNNDRIY